MRDRPVRLLNISIFLFSNREMSPQGFLKRLSNKDYEFDGWKDSVSHNFLLFMGFLISCLLNAFFETIFRILL